MDSLLDMFVHLKIEDRRTNQEQSVEEELSEMMSSINVSKKFWFQHKYPPIQPPSDEKKDQPLNSDIDEKVDDLIDTLCQIRLKDKIICHDDYFLLEKEDRKLIIWKVKKCSVIAGKMDHLANWTIAF
jgi:hypothetical protein